MKINLLIIILTITLLVSCKKRVTNKIQGKWNMVPLNEYFIDKNVSWDFAENDNLIITTISSDTTKIDSAKYIIKVNALGKKTIEITEREKNNGTYLINKISKTILKLQRTAKEDGETAGAFLWYEFVKP